jgi:hypothetical protein
VATPVPVTEIVGSSGMSGQYADGPAFRVGATERRDWGGYSRYRPLGIRHYRAAGSGDQEAVLIGLAVLGSACVSGSMKTRPTANIPRCGKYKSAM